MEIFYHGSSALFREFCLSLALEGDGKMKFGFGIYVTQSYRTAAHYASTGKGASAEDHYVYTVEVPESREDNHLWSNRPVHPAIVRRAETRLKELIPQEVVLRGKLFRKYIGNKMLGRKGTVRQLSGKADVETEKAAARFLVAIGVEFLVWPCSQNKPDGEQNRAILDEECIRVVRIERVEVKNGRLVTGMEKEVRL